MGVGSCLSTFLAKAEKVQSRKGGGARGMPPPDMHCQFFDASLLEKSNMELAARVGHGLGFPVPLFGRLGEAGHHQDNVAVKVDGRGRAGWVQGSACPSSRLRPKSEVVEGQGFLQGTPA